MMKLLLLFISVPLIEVLILIKLGDLMGFWPTVWMVIGTGALGALLARIQGFRAWLRIQEELRVGRLPASDMVDALLIFVAGLVLLTPGLLTDLLGFFLLVPFTRGWFKRKVGEFLERKISRTEGTGRFVLRS